jgi:hypothetical protein
MHNKVLNGRTLSASIASGVEVTEGGPRRRTQRRRRRRPRRHAAPSRPRPAGHTPSLHTPSSELFFCQKRIVFLTHLASTHLVYPLGPFLVPHLSVYEDHVWFEDR